MALSDQLQQRRTTRLRVHVVERLASGLITVGGIAVVAAVMGICVYLAVTAARLVRSGALTPVASAAFSITQRPLLFDVDEYMSSALVLTPQGELRQIELATGKIARRQTLAPPGRTITAIARSLQGGHVALGYDDGSVQAGVIDFDVGFLPEPGAGSALAALKVGGSAVEAEGVVQRTPLGQLRTISVSVSLTTPVPLAHGSGPVEVLHYQAGGDQRNLLAMRGDGALILSSVRITTPLGGGEPRLSMQTTPLPAWDRPQRAGKPGWIFVTSDSAHVLLLWEDGVCGRYALLGETPAWAESGAVLDAGRTVRSAALLLGGQTLVVGDDKGGVTGSFVARDPAAATPDKHRLVRAHTLAVAPAPVRTIAPSRRDRCFAIADERGGVSVHNMTSQKRVADARLEGGAAPLAAVLSPKLDGLVALDAGGRAAIWSLEPGHPEASWSSLFAPVWYEGQLAPSHTYQSSSGDDAAEPKYGLTPLIYGTLKATLYTMLLAVPAGVLGAIYTREFLSKRARAVVKPAIEMMASLPSVVLGFIAAMLLAPVLSDHLPAVMVSFMVLPLAALLAANAWDLLPTRLRHGRFTRWRTPAVALTVLIALALCPLVGSAVERVLFRPSEGDVLVMAGSFEPLAPAQRPAWVGERTELTTGQRLALHRAGIWVHENTLVRPVGSLGEDAVRRIIERGAFDHPSMRQWLNGAFGGAWPGWFLLCWPASCLLAAWAMSRWWPRSRWVSGAVGPAWAVVGLLRVLLGVLIGAVIAAGVAWLLGLLNLDPRESIFGTFQQRNSLVVALAMAVAVIPIIYTICEDALGAVPEYLRSASLASGATPWQTAVRVLVPVAMSGIFSAVMIGLGRAVGETMIILMATGNTPVMSPSIFDGMRTLSANIAVELPEAPKDSTHYRVLFLCGLVLFVMTFAINTIAELVRIRYRKRSAAL